MAELCCLILVYLKFLGVFLRHILKRITNADEFSVSSFQWTLLRPQTTTHQGTGVKNSDLQHRYGLSRRRYVPLVCIPTLNLVGWLAKLLGGST